MILDGYLEVAIPSDPVQYYSAFDAAITSVKSDTSFMMLEVSGKADSATGRVFIRFAADSVAPGSSPMLYCVVTADSLIDLLGAAYYRVPVQFLPDRNGRPVSVARGDTLVDTLTFATAGQRIDKLGAVVFVEDASGTEEHRVLQAATIKSFEMTEEK